MERLVLWSATVLLTVGATMDSSCSAATRTQLASELRQAGLPAESLLWRGEQRHTEELAARRQNYMCTNASWATPPLLLALPRHTADVATLVQVTERLGFARLAVRGRGHSYLCQGYGQAGHNDTVLLDTSAMQGMELDISPDGDPMMTVGAGVSWTAAKDFLDTHGMFSIHGNCGSVGVIGCSLHGCVELGGISYSQGLAVDHILGVTIVLLDGRCLKLTSSSAVECDPSSRVVDPDLASDLWFSVRGAGSSIGVVTSLSLRVFEGQEPNGIQVRMRRVQGDTPALPDVVNALKSFPEGWGAAARWDCQTNSWSTVTLMRPLDEPETDTELQVMIMQALVANRTEDKLAISAPRTVAPWIEHGDVYSHVWGAEASFSVASAVLPVGSNERLFEDLDRATQDMCGGVCDGCWGILARVGAAARERARVSGTCLNPARAQSEFFFEVDCGASSQRWRQCEDRLRGVQRVLDASSSPQNTWHYMNIPNLFSVGWSQFAYGSNQARLWRIKQRLDPKQRLVFMMSLS